MIRGPPIFPRFPYTTLFRSRRSPPPRRGDGGRDAAPSAVVQRARRVGQARLRLAAGPVQPHHRAGDRKSTRLNSSHANISYAVFCLKKKKNTLLYLLLNNIF